MKAIQIEKPQLLRRIDIADPPAPGRDEALVQIHRVGICGTDYSGYLGKMPFFSYPRIPGHELGVEVLAVGEAVTHLTPGTRCAVEPYLNCGSCFACQQGQGNCCENLKVLGVMTDGGMCERIVLPARKLHPASELSFDQCALVETLAIGCHAVNRSGAATGENVLVIGAGPIGLAVIEFVKLCGARTMVMDLSAERLDFVRRTMNITETIAANAGGAELDQLHELTNGTLANVVIDATGSHISMGRALNYVAFTGRLVFVGITTEQIAVAHPLMHRREMTLRASRNAHPADFVRIIQLIARGKIDTRPWITHHAPFEEMIESFSQWVGTESGVIKAMVDVC